MVSDWHLATMIATRNGFRHKSDMLRMPSTKIGGTNILMLKAIEKISPLSAG
jgi:hypothetical protein